MTNRREILTEELTKFWTRKEFWEIQDAALLFVGVDPNSDFGVRLKRTLRDEPGFSFSDLSDDEKAQCAEVQDITELVYDSDSLAVHERWNGSVQYEVVRPNEFLIWVRDKFEREPPIALRHLIGGAQSRAELERELVRLRSQLGETQARTTKAQTESLEPGERTTMRKLGAYFAKRFRYNSDAAKNPATTQIKQELEKYGVQLDEKTIRKLLKLGLDHSSD